MSTPKPTPAPNAPRVKVYHGSQHHMDLTPPDRSFEALLARWRQLVAPWATQPGTEGA
jgi:hypothetical protein